MTDLFRAYAHQVASYHPAAAREDLFSEVYDELCEEFEDWKAKNPGRSEAEFLDARREHPMKLATRMAGERTAYLVGPSLYFSFLSALKSAAAIVVVVHVVLAAVRVFAGASVPSAALGLVSGLPETLLWVCAAVLGVFVALEKSGERAKWLDDWTAADLKSIDSHQEVSRLESSFDLAFSTLALLWVLDIVELPATIRHDSDWVVDWTLNVPDWTWWAAGILLAFGVVFSLYRLSQPFWTRSLRWITVGENLLWLALLAFVVTRPELLTTTHDGGADFVVFVERALKGGLSVIMVIIGWDTVKHAWQLIRRSS
jgi:hypothetical protein